MTIVRRRMIISSILAGTALALLAAADIFPGMADWYSTHIYPVLVSVIGRISGVMPYSVSEILLYVLSLSLVCTGSRLLFRRIVKRTDKTEALRWVSGWVLLVCFLFFLYVINCGMNYRRISFSESTRLETIDYTADELKEVCLWLTEAVNEHSSRVKRDGGGVMIAADDTGKSAAEVMKKLGKVYPEMEGYYPRPKGLLFPYILSVQNLTGVYSPFTVEANYNSGITDYNIPFTMCHELSHLRGFMQEEEANFIAWLACTQSGEPEFQYSGSLLGWIYSMSVLRKIDIGGWQEVRDLLNPEAEADLRANSKFWGKYDGRIAEVSNKINDTYLKANGQADGVKSYNRMVDLLVAYYYL